MSAARKITTAKIFAQVFMRHTGKGWLVAPLQPGHRSPVHGHRIVPIKVNSMIIINREKIELGAGWSLIEIVMWMVKGMVRKFSANFS